MCVMCSTSVPTLFQYFFYDHIPTFLYIFHEMFFITCNNNNDQKMNTGVLVSWRLNTSAKLSVDVSDVFSHERSRKGLHQPRKALN